MHPARGAEGPFVAVGPVPVLNKDQALQLSSLFVLMLYLGA